MKNRNQVLTDDAHTSANFYQSDLILRRYLEKYLGENALNYMKPKLNRLGEQAAGRMNELSRRADRNEPTLKKRTKLGETVNEVEFHPDYWELMDIAAESEMLYVKYEPELRKRFSGERHKMGFAAGQLYGMTELGQYCPLCMTDGAAHLVDQFASEEDRKRLLPKLSAKTGDELFTGAMFLTEKKGGSDVGANLCRAEKIKGNQYSLNGEKWFCSNVNADVMMVLARTGTLKEGTRGLSLFLVEKELPDGNRNLLNIIRLKDKLGVRSMATGEVELNGTQGTLLGKEGDGFKVMAEMINISRTYNAVAALAGSRRAIVEAYQYLHHRKTFGKRAIEHSLIRQKFHELGSIYLADFLLVWRTIRAMDAVETSEKLEKELMRLIVPMVKWKLGESCVYIIRECMELMGGNGYIEDFIMPRLLRDLNVLPIWEGAGNIMILDILRAAQKSAGLTQVMQAIEESAAKSKDHGDAMQQRLNELKTVYQELLEEKDRDVVEATAKPLFTRLIHLYQIALLIDEKEAFSNEAVDLAISSMNLRFHHPLGQQNPPSPQQIDSLIGWDY